MGREKMKSNAVAKDGSAAPSRVEGLRWPFSAVLNGGKGLGQPPTLISHWIQVAQGGRGSSLGQRASLSLLSHEPLATNLPASWEPAPLP